MSEHPVRIQRSRAKGWRMPENTVYVGRPTMWGNRWQIGTHSNLLGRSVETLAEAVECYRRIAFVEPHMTAWVREQLRGKNLACWCPLDQECHADVLLELANAGDAP